MPVRQHRPVADGAVSAISSPASSTRPGAGNRNADLQPGTDLEYTVNVDFWTAVRGGTARLQILRQDICPTCHGKASSGVPMECPECHGTGQVTQMGGRMKFNIQCPRCGGSGRIQETLPHLPRRRHRAATGNH